MERFGWKRTQGRNAISRKQGMMVMLMACLVVGTSFGLVHADSFMDKLKEAAKKNAQKNREQQRQQQSQQQQQPQPPQQQEQQEPQQRPAAAQAGQTTTIKSFDIRDVALGMSQPEADALLRKLYPDFHVVPVNYRGYGQQWTGVLLAMPKTKNKDEVVLVDFAQPPLPRKVIAITRYKEFPSNATPSLENVESSLTEKYGQWSKGEETKRAGYRKLYGWWTNPSPNSCVNERLTATFGRLKKIIDAEGLSRVLGDAYGDPGQYVTAFREFVPLNSDVAACGKQVAAEVKHRPDQHLTPVNSMVVVVADFATLHESEVEFKQDGQELQRGKGHQRRAARWQTRSVVPVQ
jgi:hypothetical protein